MPQTGTDENQGNALHSVAIGALLCSLTKLTCGKVARLRSEVKGDWLQVAISVQIGQMTKRSGSVAIQLQRLTERKWRCTYYNHE